MSKFYPCSFIYKMDTAHIIIDIDEPDEKFGFNVYYSNNKVNFFTSVEKKKLAFYFDIEQKNAFKVLKKTFILIMSSITIFLLKFWI